MTYHPGWHAYVDGKETEKIILSPGLTGVKLGKGLHEIRFAYYSPWWKTFLFLAGFITAIVLYKGEKK